MDETTRSGDGGRDGDDRAALEDLRRRGASALEAGEVGAAFTHFEAALARADVLGDAAAVADLRFQLGRVAMEFGDLAGARRWLTLALDARVAISEDDENDVDSAAVRLELARVAVRSGFPDEAKRHLGPASRAFRRADDRSGEGRCRLEFADVALRQGDMKIAGLELQSASRLLAPDDGRAAAERLVLLAALADASGDEFGAIERLAEAAEAAAAPTVNGGLATHIEAMLTSRRGGERRPIHRWPQSLGTGDPVAVTFVSVVLDPRGEIGPSQVVESTSLDADNVGAYAGFIHGVVEAHSGVPIDGEPRVRITYVPWADVFGAATAVFEIDGQDVGAAIVATGSDPNEEAWMAQVDPFASYLAGRYRTENYYGFGRQAAMRQGAIATIKERPVSFFIALPGTDDVRLVEAAFARHLEFAAAFVGLIQSDGDGAERLRASVEAKRNA